MLHGDFFKDSIVVHGEHHHAMKELAAGFHGAAAMAIHGLQTLPFWLALAGVVVSWFFYMKAPHIPRPSAAHWRRWSRCWRTSTTSTGSTSMCWLPGTRLLGKGLWKGGDGLLIDGLLVNGSARAVGLLAGLSRLVQTGHVYWYALVMLLGVFGLLTWQLWPALAGLAGH